MWLTGRLVPDHKTIADFRKDNGPPIRKVCAQFVALTKRFWPSEGMPPSGRLPLQPATVAEGIGRLVAGVQALRD
jgi:hypothetical protein